MSSFGVRTVEEGLRWLNLSGVRRHSNVKPNSKLFCQFSVEVGRSMKNIKPDVETAFVIISTIWGASLHI